MGRTARRWRERLKSAHAHYFTDGGQLWTTEVAEAIGGSSAPDETNRVLAGADYGWPACVGDRDPVAAGGTIWRVRADD